MLDSVKAFGDTAEVARQESVGIIAFHRARVRLRSARYDLR